MLLALGIVVSGCSSGLRTQRYAVFHIRGAYPSATRTNHFAGELRQARFTLTCRSPRHYQGLYGPPSWRQRLCLAILDSRTRRSTGILCAGCPPSIVRVDVRGTIRGRPVHERFTSCLCGDGPQAAADARVILLLHPPFRTPAT